MVVAGGHTTEQRAERPAPGAASAPIVLGAGVEPGSPEERVVDAMLACVGRWGLGKTTIGDVARAAGTSRATVYRLFPGGKRSILQAGIETEVTRLVALVHTEVAGIDDLEACLARAIAVASGFLRHNEALEYLRAHEWETIETFLAFDRLDTLFLLSGALLSPALERFLDADRARHVAMWAARIVVSHLLSPSDELDLTDVAVARHVVHTYLMPGLVPVDTPSAASAEVRTS